ncbi:MAG: glycosyltransferase [Bacteroidota bacterium]
MPDRPLRVALVGPAPPYRGGIAHFLVSTAKRLRGRGHAVEVVTFTRQYPSLLFPGKTQYAEGEPASDGSKAVRLLDSIGLRSWGRTARHLRAWEPDVVVFMQWMPFFAPAFGTVARQVRKDGARVLAVVHNALPHEPRPGDHALMRYFLKATDGLVVLSDSVRSDLARLGVDEAQTPVRQVRHPVYDHFGDALPRAEARRRLELPADVPVLLFFGFVRAYKGLDVLLDAMPRVLERVPEARLVVAGEFYEDEAAYRERAATLGTETMRAVRFDADYIPDAEVATYFSAADVVVQPYRSATQSGVAQIAFHFARPVVTTDVGGLAETVPDGEAGLVVPPEDPAALAAALVRFFDDDLAETLAAGVRRESARYSWDHLLEALEALAVPPMPRT